MAALALAAALAACSEDGADPLPFDPSTENLFLRGKLTGLELENFDLESFGVGDNAIISNDVAPGPGQASFELRMDGDAIHYERSAIAGSVDVRVYEDGTTVPGTPDVQEGGSMGAVFEVDFGAGETMEGSFHVDFSVAAVEDEEC